MYNLRKGNIYIRIIQFLIALRSSCCFVESNALCGKWIWYINLGDNKEVAVSFLEKIPKNEFFKS